MHVDTLHKTAVLKKPGHIYGENFSGFPSDVLQLLCLNSVENQKFGFILDDTSNEK